MPELPDLQAFSHNLNKALKGKKVKEISILVSKKLNVPVKELKERLEGQGIKAIYREGKQLYISFSKGDILSLHLMLHGNLYLYEGKNAKTHTILDILFDDSTGMVMTDWQSMAAPTLNPPIPSSPDALSAAITFPFFKEKLQTRRNIKTVLLDQKIIRGIGNAYADEILWSAGISPFSISKEIPDKAIKALISSIKKVLTQAEKKILKHNPAIITGEVRDFLLIHNAKNKISPAGVPIEIKIASGRKTYYTKEQVIYE